MALRAMAASLASRALTMSRGVAPAAVCRAAALATPSRVSVCGAFTPSMAGSRMQLAGRCFATDGPALHMADILKQELEFELGDYAPPAVRDSHACMSNSAHNATRANLVIVTRRGHHSSPVFSLLVAMCLDARVTRDSHQSADREGPFRYCPAMPIAQCHHPVSTALNQIPSSKSNLASIHFHLRSLEARYCPSPTKIPQSQFPAPMNP